MKNKTLFLLLILTIIGLVFVFVYVFNVFKTYNKSVKEAYYASFSTMNSWPTDWGLNNIEIYLRDSCKFPVDIDAICTEGEGIAWFDEYMYSDLSDFMSYGCKGNLQYIPLYDSNKTIVAAALLSVGIDKKMNTVVDRTDTIYLDRFLDQIPVYNPCDFRSILSEDTAAVLEFSFKDYYFGTKDYLVLLITPFKRNDEIDVFNDTNDIEELEVIRNFKSQDKHIIYPKKEGNEILERLLNSGKNENNDEDSCFLKYFSLR